MPRSKSDTEIINEMTQGEFAKLFEIEESQVLVQWDYDNVDDSYLLKFDFRIEEVRAAVTIDGFKKVENCLEAFNKLDESKISAFYDSILRQADGDPINLILQ